MGEPFKAVHRPRAVPSALKGISLLSTFQKVTHLQENAAKNLNNPLNRARLVLQWKVLSPHKQDPDSPVSLVVTDDTYKA